MLNLTGLGGSDFCSENRIPVLGTVDLRQRMAGVEGSLQTCRGYTEPQAFWLPASMLCGLPTLPWSSFSHLQDGAENETLGICASNATKGSVSTRESGQDLVGSLFNLSQRDRVLACPVCPTMVEGMWRVRIDSLFLATYWPKSQCRLLTMSHTLPSLPRWKASVPHQIYWGAVCQHQRETYL